MLTDFKDTTFGEMQQGQAAATTEAVAPNQNETTTVDAAIAPLVEPAVAAAATTTDAATADAPIVSPATGDNTVEFELPAFAVEQTDTTQQPQPAAPSWKEAIKAADKKELLKEAGLDDFLIGLHEYIQQGGSPESFLQAKATDWNKVSDEALVKQQLKAEFPDATDAQVERFFNKRFTQGEIYEQEDNEDGLLLMKNEARKLRAQRLEQQSKLPVIPQQQPLPTAPPEPTIPPEVEKYGTAIAQSKVFQDARTSKRVAVTLPDGKPIHFDISQPDLLMHSLFNPEFQRKLNMTQQGEPDVQIVAEKALFNLNPSFVKKALYNAGYEAAKAAIIAEHQNAGLPKQVAAGSDAVPFKQVWGQAKISTYGGG